MRHGYTNDTGSDGDIVTKRYRGPDVGMRLTTEAAALAFVRDHLPVPEVIPPSGADPVSDAALHLALVPGVHGQELLDNGHGPEVLRACGVLVARLQAIDSGSVPEAIPGSGTVLVHGDFGPNNLLLDPRTLEPTALVDWEWAHLGEPIEDLAGCELIVRMHHQGHVTELDAFFAAYDARPSWHDRQAAMVARCEALVRFCERWDDGGAGAGMWRDRVATVSAWTE